jgi:prepilin-type N-terminal cleavage/methylation domain-containing protein
MMRQSKSNCEKGFTIFELIVVLAIIGILAGVLYPKLQNREVAAKLQAVEMDMLRIYEACEAWKANRGQQNFAGLTYAALNTAGLWNTAKTNPWGGTYSIAVNNTGGPSFSVMVYSGAIADTEIQSALQARLSNKKYTTGIDANKGVWFRAPY